MNRIDTDISEIVVEIEENEYPVAEKTVDVAEQLISNAKKQEGQPVYKLWLSELEILLGKEAVRKLFPNGKRENIDRLQRIHAGVMRAFEHNADELREQESEQQREKLALAADFLKALKDFSKSEAPTRPIIHRPA